MCAIDFYVLLFNLDLPLLAWTRRLCVRLSRHCFGWHCCCCLREGPQLWFPVRFPFHQSLSRWASSLSDSWCTGDKSYRRAREPVIWGSNEGGPQHPDQKGSRQMIKTALKNRVILMLMLLLLRNSRYVFPSANVISESCACQGLY